MRPIFLALLVCAILLATSIPAAADTIDDFVITGQGNVITFSLLASPVSSPSIGAGGSDTGFSVYPPPITVNGIVCADYSMQFISANFSTTTGLIFETQGFMPGGYYAPSVFLAGPKLFTGTSANPTFIAGLDAQYVVFGLPGDYTLTITPETAPVPEPSTLVLVLTGGFTLTAFVRRKLPLA